MKAPISSPAYSRPSVGILSKTDAALSVRPLRAEESDRERRDRRLLLGGANLGAAAHRVDGVEIDRQRRVQRIIGEVVILDAGDAEVRRIVAAVDHDAGDRRLSDSGDKLGRQRLELLRDQERIAAAANVKHALGVEIEPGLEPVVGAQNLHRQPRGHDLGDRGRDERLVGVLGDELVALGVHNQHDRRWIERRDLVLKRRRAPGRARAARRERAGETTWRLRRGR